tara:strand:+ start:7123 stop:8160 length:1038 start_codon:yes stop_codon:yes gene_type:complete
MKRIVFVFILVISFLACKKEKEAQAPTSSQVIQASSIIVLNEGNFQWGNASLSLYNPNTKVVENDVFLRNNNQLPIGDVVQSMIQVGDLGYVVVNNSNKIRVIDLNNFHSLGSIEPFNSPRYILPIHQNKAYVSDLYEDKLYVVDLVNRSILKTIPTHGWTEEMVLVGDKAFVSQVDSSQVLVFDVVKDSLLKVISTNTSPQCLEVDVNQNVWVSCTGGLNSNLASLHQIDSDSLVIRKTLEQSSSSDFIGEIELNATADEIYYLTNEGIMKMNIQQTSLPTTPFIPHNNRNLYGFSINPLNNDIYLIDAVDYQQKGYVYRYLADGSLVDQFQVGIIPGDVFFKN